MQPFIEIYGAGLAGCEAAWQAAERGVRVRLYEMKPHKYSPAHHSEGFAELVCAKKYTDDELVAILQNESTPVFVAVDEKDEMLGYAFCIFIQHKDNNILTDVKTLYIDDLCVDESTRGTGVGRKLYDHVVAFAKAEGCYNLTLNVWACNEGARRFYERLGLVPQKYGMETILDKNG